MEAAHSVHFLWDKPVGLPVGSKPHTQVCSGLVQTGETEYERTSPMERRPRISCLFTNERRDSSQDSSAVSDIAYEYFADAFAVRVNGSFQERSWTSPAPAVLRKGEIRPRCRGG